MRLLGITLFTSLTATTAWAGLAIGEVRYNPDLSGSGQVGSAGPFYTDGTPAWLDPGNVIASMSSPISGVPGFGQFVGTVESRAYQNGATVGLSYEIVLEPNSADRLVRSSVGPAGWSGVMVPDAGSTGSGSSLATTGPVNWSDGDPHFVSRDAGTGAPYWQFRLGNNGTSINSGQESALIWFETNSTEIGETTITLQDGGVVGGALVLSIPEPASLSLLLGGAALFLIRRR